ncbi:MAG: RloB family protein [Simkaniaceae bacterium]|nr:RloB family protein [Simkaniaceae bacterium]
MPKKPRIFQRPLGERRYKKLFVISVEGSKTEPQYFAIFNQPQSIVLVKCLNRSSTESSPIHVLKEMQGYLQKESLRKTDEAWIVVDKDDWTEDQLKKLLQWAKKSENHGFALSNPNFEYWLLLHFEDGKGIANSQECLTRLKRHLPNYKKDIDSKKITLELITKAITRAKQRDTNRSNDLPQIWSTTVYKLIERIIDHK